MSTHVLQTKKYEKEETKTNKFGSAHLVQYRFKIRGDSPEGISMTMEKRFVKEMSFKSGVKGRGTYRDVRSRLQTRGPPIGNGNGYSNCTIQYDTIVEFNVYSKLER